MEIGRLDRGGELVAEFHRFGGRLDLDLVFRLAVFLDPEGNAGGDAVGYLIDPRCHWPSGASLGMMTSVSTRAELVGFEVVDFHGFLAAAVDEGEGAGLVGPPGFVGFEVAEIAEEELEVDGVAGFVERAVGDAVGEVAVAIFP